jgi:hypothetical protein
MCVGVHDAVHIGNEPLECVEYLVEERSLHETDGRRLNRAE